jgi:hypothetical protein
MCIKARQTKKGQNVPRPKTELTNNPKIVGARLTQELFKEWRKLGGAVWLRKYLEESQKKRIALGKKI